MVGVDIILRVVWFEISGCRILGLTTFNSFSSMCQLVGFEVCSVNRTKKLGYINLNWPRCSAWVTESLALTDGSFSRKQNVENLNQARSDRRTVELRFSWEGVLNHTWISPWTQKGILLCEMDPRKRSVTYVFMNDETSV